MRNERGVQIPFEARSLAYGHPGSSFFLAAKENQRTIGFTQFSRIFCPKIVGHRPQLRIERQFIKNPNIDSDWLPEPKMPK
jgi:hypothetical protein